MPYKERHLVFLAVQFSSMYGAELTGAGFKYCKLSLINPNRSAVEWIEHLLLK